MILGNSKWKNREIYSALCYVLREEIINKKEHFAGTSQDVNELAPVVDSGFETFHQNLPSECSSKLISGINADQIITPYRRKYVKLRPEKVLLRKLRNVTYDGVVVKNTFDIKLRNVKQHRNTYPYIVTAIMCCFACFIAFVPHRFFPWFFPLISFNSPPPL
ncbi:unnamed protein product [Litomosoides sigmodontis]|uniref:Uncharacterized protein n=1 Tax=Litomosoides sigmodontis TaxID=42156 RepID=A0A3P6UNR1_LITSI|nr:unnamed protein product [Litomosoides sigmodontis]